MLDKLTDMNFGKPSSGVIICLALEGGKTGLLPTGIFQETDVSIREKYEHFIKKNSDHRWGRISGFPSVRETIEHGA